MNGDCSCSRPLKHWILRLLYIYISAFVLGIILAPLCQWLLWLYHDHFPSSFSTYLVNKPFEKVFWRVLFLCFLVVFSLNFRKEIKFRKLGICTARWREWFAHFFMAAGLTALLCIFFMIKHHQWCKFSMGSIALARNIFVAALLIGFLEEVIFRGIILQGFSENTNRKSAMLYSAIIFAFLHFRAPSSIGAFYGRHITLIQSFKVGLYHMFGFVLSFRLFPFFSLTVLGLIAALLFYKSGGLMAPMGFHSGVVFVTLFYEKTIARQFHENVTHVIDSPFTTSILLCLLFFFYKKMLNETHRNRG